MQKNSLKWGEMPKKGGGRNGRCLKRKKKVLRKKKVALRKKRIFRKKYKQHQRFSNFKNITLPLIYSQTVLRVQYFLYVQ